MAARTSSNTIGAAFAALGVLSAAFAALGVFSAAFAALAAIAGAASSASAQGYPYRRYQEQNWDRWESPRPMREPTWQAEPYDERSDELDTESADPQDDSNSDENRYGDAREMRERRNAERQFRDQYRGQYGEPPRYFERGRVIPRRYDPPRRDADTGDDEQDNDRGRSRRDTAREPSAADSRAQAPGFEGGSQPYIAPVAPPRVAFGGGRVPGSIVIDTGARKLYFVTGPTSAFAYPIGVGREGFAWTGSEKVSRVADWPDWYPPAEMRKRKPELPERMLGGINNPLGAKAIYLGNTLYRIHGTNDPKSIGRAESSGCFRMLNGHVLHLASLVQVGAQVSVVHSLRDTKVAARPATPKKRITDRASPPPRWNTRGYDTYDSDYR